MESQLPYHLRNSDKRGVCRQCGSVVYHVKSDGYMHEGWFAVENEEPNSVCPKATIGHKHWAAKRTVQIMD